MNKGLFITGTDTDVGKTTAAIALIRALKQAGYVVAGYKPVSAGCIKHPQGLRNDDALLLQQSGSIDIPYEIINPYAFEPPIAPHIAAQQNQQSIKIGRILECYQHINQLAQWTIVEGAGGWLVPIDTHQTMADIAVALQTEVILVVGIRLGCLNHTLLTNDSIINRGCTLAGWIANKLEPDMPNQQQNIDYLRNRIQAPLIATLPYLQDTQNAKTEFFNLELLY